MQLPDLLPKELHFVSKAASDEALFAMLSPQTALLTDFFENACEDETWCQKHALFFSRAIDWFTEGFFRHTLSRSFASRVVKAMQKHFRGLQNIIPKSLIVNNMPMNKLMVGLSSEVLFYRIGETLPLNVALDHFLLYKQFIEMNYASDLWKYNLEELLALHTEAKQLGLSGFMDCLADTMKRYLTRENVVGLLILGHDELWESLKDHCIDCLNRLEEDAQLRKYSVDELAFEFLAFSPFSWNLFSQLKSRITHLICSGSLTEEPDFGSALQQCPKITSLDVTLSESLSPYFIDLPKLIELNLSMCGWLNGQTIKSIDCLEIKILKLKSNTHLKYTFWQSLMRFKALESLDISRCLQVGDEEIKIIGSALPGLKELYLQECTALSDIGFTSLARQCPQLIFVDFGRTALGDQALLEFASYCPQLYELRLVRCEQVTERGIAETLRLARNLGKLDLTRCFFTKALVESLRKKHPYVEIDF